MKLIVEIETEVGLLIAKHDQYQFKNKDNTKEDDVTEYVIWLLKEKGYVADLKEKRNKIIAEKPEITDAR